VAAVALAGSMPMAQAARSGLAKIAAAMSLADRARTAELAGRILVPEQGAEQGPVAARVKRALADRRLLEIGYQDRRGAASYRAVEPVCLLAVDHRW
jgi:predicted DNA-binding transcriptional regulator YafY